VTRRILLDTDLAMGAPGSDIDDGFALALALADPELSVELVTTVNGNTDVDTATTLSLHLLDRLGRADVPVVRGAARPLLRPAPARGARTAPVQLRPGREAAAGVAATAIVDRAVQVRLTREHARRMAAGGRAFGAFAGSATQDWIDHTERTRPGDLSEHGSCALHDPLAVAVVTRPELVTWRPAYVAVETAGEVARGVTVADLLGSDQPPQANCEIATAVDVEAFTELFLERVSAL
jgi:purine nucleosidase